MLHVRELGKRYGAKWVFRGLDFSLQKGQALVVLGRNGSGKSTLLSILAGLIGATEGAVEVSGDRRRTLGYSALDMAVYPHLTVAEHLSLAASMRGVQPNEGLLELVGLEHAGGKQGRELSTGMRNRLKIALAIQPEPLVLLLDEPGAALDEAGRKMLEGVCEAQRQRGVLVIATNDPAERRLGTHELELAG
ncbi:MAG TPA: ABC transporter ATP-binding protein [Fimbriimonadaceae bacterium]|nr:ABC transporter ATP-binding protein [Fimbriimonadaceae bacterium]